MVVLMLVTKNSSVPTLSTAFWLLSVAMRGLDSTCTLPWVSRNVQQRREIGGLERQSEQPARRAGAQRQAAGDAGRGTAGKHRVGQQRAVGAAGRRRADGAVALQRGARA